jgi:hypothetical protein
VVSEAESAFDEVFVQSHLRGQAEVGESKPAIGVVTGLIRYWASPTRR